MSESDRVEEKLKTLASGCNGCDGVRPIIVFRALTPVDEEKLPEHKKVMTNTKIQTFNEAIEKIVKNVREAMRQSVISKKGEVAMATMSMTQLPYHIRFFDSYNFYIEEDLLESIDGVHFTTEAVFRDTLTVLSLAHQVQQDQESAASLAFPHLVEETKEVEAEKQRIIEQRNASPKSTVRSEGGDIKAVKEGEEGKKAINGSQKAGEGNPPKRGGDPCYEVGCLSLPQLGLIFVFGSAWVSIICLKLWRGRRASSILRFLRQLGNSGHANEKGGEDASKLSSAVLPLANDEKKEEESTPGPFR